MITIVFPNELFMEKNFTLMKTLTAFFNLLCGKKNVCALNNDATGASVDCPLTRVNNQSNNIDDPDKSGSFLFYNQSAIDDQTAGANDSSPITGDQKLKNNDADNHSKRSMNDELASGNGSTSIYDHARWRVNDDLAACSAINSEWPVVNGYYPGVNSEWQLWNKNILAWNTQTTKTEPKNTRTNQNDAWLPFASFSFFFTDLFAEILMKAKALGKVNIVRLRFSKGGIIRSVLGKGRFVRRLVRRVYECKCLGLAEPFLSIVNGIMRGFERNHFNKNLKAVFIPIEDRRRAGNDRTKIFK